MRALPSRQVALLMDGQAEYINIHERPIMSTHPKSLCHIIWCQKFLLWSNFLWSFNGICRFVSSCYCLKSNVIQIPVLWIQSNWLTLCRYVFFRLLITCYQKKILPETHHKTLNKFIIRAFRKFWIDVMEINHFKKNSQL